MANVLKKIPLIKKNNQIQEVKPPFEKSPDLEKMYLYVTIVDQGQGRAVEKLMKTLGVSVQFAHLGEGTATSSVREILNISDENKEIIFSFVKQSKLENIYEEINAFLFASKKNRGIGFSIELNSLMGVKIYKFLSDSMR